MKGYIKQNYKTFLIGLASLLFMWLIWFIAQKSIKNEYLVPSVLDTFKALKNILSDGFFYKALLKSLLKVILSIAISYLLAGICAVLGKNFKGVTSFLVPFVSMFRTLPTMAILVLILFYTNTFIAPIIVTVLVMFPMVYAQFNTALDTIDQKTIFAVKVFKLTKRQSLFKVYLPLISPSICSHLGSNLSFSLKIVISAEVMTNAFTNIGGLMQTARALEDIPTLLALTLFSVLLGILIEVVWNIVFSFMFKWNKMEAKDDRA